MIPSPPEDRRLVAFLKAHQPTPPEADDRTEHQLMARVTQHPQDGVRGDRRRSWAWLPGVMAAGLLLALPLGAPHLGRRSPSLLPTSSGEPPQHTASTTDLNGLSDFLWDSWGGLLGYGAYGLYSSEGQVYSSDLLFD